MPVTYVCSTCGSNDVSRDAWAEWSVEDQQWVLRTEFDYAHCHRCDRETNLVEVQLNPPETVVLGSE
ncbi:hypothetical protein [Sphingosinicella sp. YJ22]|uniref:hypothetical protein n=1 Tax=Sphingosinicella sp. YJ22 TaxID=1104780 RepID=UPI00140C89E8|nr:hypothetical protein [Sphingosinicella sp. YJ22]